MSIGVGSRVRVKAEYMRDKEGVVVSIGGARYKWYVRLYGWTALVAYNTEELEEIVVSDLKPGDAVTLHSAAYDGWPATIHERHTDNNDPDTLHWSVTLRSGKHVCIEAEHVKAVESESVSIVRYWIDTPDFGGRWVKDRGQWTVHMYGWSDGVVTWTEKRNDVSSR